MCDCLARPEVLAWSCVPCAKCCLQPHSYALAPEKRTIALQIEVVARRGDIHDAASLIAQYQSELTALRAELDALRRDGALRFVQDCGARHGLGKRRLCSELPWVI